MYKKILVVVEDSKESQSAVKHGIELAKTHQASILFFHVLPRYEIVALDVPAPMIISPKDFQVEVNERATRLLASASEAATAKGVQSSRSMGSGVNDATCVADAAKHHRCELIVVGTESRNAVMRLLTGSIVPGLITVSEVPVLICKKLIKSTKPTRSTKPTKTSPPSKATGSAKPIKSTKPTTAIKSIAPRKSITSKNPKVSKKPVENT